MNIGKFDRRIRIEVAAGKDPDYGTPTGARVPVAEVWARWDDLLPASAERAATANVNYAARPARVQIRWTRFIQIEPDMICVALDRSNAEYRIATRGAEIGNKDALEFVVEEYTKAGSA